MAQTVRPRPTTSEGIFVFNLGFPGITAAPFQFNVSFAPGTMTTDIIRQLDAALHNTAWPTGVEYFGLENGLPVFGHEQHIELLSYSFGDTPSGGFGFLVGRRRPGGRAEPRRSCLSASARRSEFRAASTRRMSHAVKIGRRTIAGHETVVRDYQSHSASKWRTLMTGSI